MKPLSWLLFATHVPASGQGGGMVRYVVELARALSRRDDVRLTLVASADAVEVLAGVVGPEQVVAMPALPTPVRSALESRALGLPPMRRFDVVHGAKHLLPRTTRAHRVLTVHDMNPLDRPGDFGLLKKVLLPRAYLAAAASADTLLCVSAATRERLLAYVPEQRDRATVVPLAGPVTLAEAVAVPVPGLAGPFLLVVGDDSARKNVRAAVERFAAVADRVPGATLVLVGPQAWRQGPVSHLLDELEAAGRVRRLGHVGDGQLRWLYENAAATLCPSVLEGFGLPTVEAAGLGSPLITSEDPAMCEVSPAGALHLLSRDARAWEDAMTAALGRPRDPGGPRPAARGWDDVAGESVEAVRDALRLR